MTVKATALDHIVLVVADVAATCAFYQSTLGLEPREEAPGKWALHAGAQKISLQQKGHEPQIARTTLPGSGNLCFLIDAPLEALLKTLDQAGIPLASAPRERLGAGGPIRSVHFRDPDGNLVEAGQSLP